MRRVAGTVLLMAGALVVHCQAQGASSGAPGEMNGLGLYNISVYSGYSTLAFPYGLTQLPVAGLQSVGGDMNYGVSFSAGWQHHRRKTDMAILYTGSYNGMLRYSNLNAFGQILTVSASRLLTPKWTVAVSLNGEDVTTPQYLFQPSPLSNMTQAPATFNDLAAAFSIGSFSSPQTASLLTTAPILPAADQALLLGDHVRTYGGNLSATYAVSSRLSLHFGSFAAGGQQAGGGGAYQQELTNYLMPFTIGASASMDYSYPVSPRTNVGVEIDEVGVRNRFQTSDSTSASAFAGRKMGRHWFLNVHGGGAYVNMVQEVYSAPPLKQWVGGGSLGFKTQSNTLLANYDRTTSNSFGFAVGTITGGGGSWAWRRPGSAWTVSTSFQREQIQDTGYYSMLGWQGAAGLQIRLSSHAEMGLEYVYIQSSGTFQGTPDKITIQSVRLTLGWSPQFIIR